MEPRKPMTMWWGKYGVHPAKLLPDDVAVAVVRRDDYDALVRERDEKPDPIAPEPKDDDFETASHYRLLLGLVLRAVGGAVRIPWPSPIANADLMQSALYTDILGDGSMVVQVRSVGESPPPAPVTRTPENPK